MINLKEKLVDALGTFGGILYFILMIISFILPVVAIGVSFELPFWVNPIMIAILFILPSSSIIFWIIGLIGVILGPQDILTIIYYIAFVLVFGPSILSIILNLFGCGRK